jgi:DNA ligase-1
MREFARLYADLDETTATNRKLEALQNYFASAAPENAAWAVYFLAGGKPRQAVPSKLLRQYAIEYAGLDDWLFDESYAAVGDTAETIAHILPPPTQHSDVGLATWMEERIGPLRGADPGTIRAALFSYWDELTWRERFLFVKLIGGGFRVGVSKLLVTRALASIAAVDSKLIAQRLMGWTDGRVKPTAAGFLQLIAAPTDNEHKLRGGQPYPFFLAHQLQGDPAALGDMGDWQVDWKYDGIRAQLVRRGGQNYLWSRGEDLITDRFPELAGLILPEGTVVDGEVLIWTRGDAPAPFADLQKRIGRKTLSAKLLAELPAVLLAYDVLELDGVDTRALPQHERRALLETLVTGAAQPQLRISPLVTADSWDDLGTLREE